MPVPADARIRNTAFRNARRRLNLSQDALVRALRDAGWTSCERRTIQRYESGEITTPQYIAMQLLPIVLTTPLEKLGFTLDADQDEDDVDRRQLLKATTAEIVGTVTPDLLSRAPARLSETSANVASFSEPSDKNGETSRPVADDFLDRREILHALGALGISVPPAIEALRHIRGTVEDVVGISEDAHLDDWNQTVSEYGYRYISEPPGSLLPDVASDLVSIRTVMARTKSQTRHRDWCRITSGLSMIMAKSLANLGQTREARAWWMTAQHAAAASQDTDLGLWVSAERLVHGLYEQRPIPVLLEQANSIAAGAPNTPGRGLAQIRTVRAQLLAVSDRRTDAVRELELSRDVFDRLPEDVTRKPGSIANWSEADITYTEAWVYAYCGDRLHLDESVARTHALLHPSQRRTHAQIDLLEAFGHVRAGDAGEGIRQAGTVYENHPADQRTTMINSLARLVLAAVPQPRLSDPSVVNYQELLAPGAESSAIT